MLEWAFPHRGKNDCKMCLLLTVNANSFAEDSSVPRLAYLHKSSVPVTYIPEQKKVGKAVNC